MKLRFENIFEAIIDDPIKAKEVNDRTKILSAVRGLLVACQWNVRDRINLSIDEESIVISRGGLKQTYKLGELLEKCDIKPDAP